MIKNIFEQNRSLVLLYSIILSIPVLFYQTTLDMAEVWWVNETFTHGFLVFPLSLWLIWGKKDNLADLAPEPAPYMLFFTLFFSFLWLISALIDIKVIMQLSMISIILSLAWGILGHKIFYFLLFPLLFLYLAVPIGQGLIPILMEFTANTTVYLVKLTGIPVYQEGFNFILPSGNWSVVEECSGVRYLIATVTLGIVYSYITYASLKKRLVFTVFTIITPIIANSLRAFIIVLLGHYSGMTIATGADHLLYGWVLFGIIIIIIFYIGSFWRDSEEEFDKSVPAPGTAISGASPVIYLVASLVVISALPYMLHQANSLNKNPSAPIELGLDASKLDQWRKNEKESVWKPIVHQPDHLLSAGYSSDLGDVQLDIGYFHTQRAGHETVSTNNKLVNQYGGTWKIVTTSVSNISDSSINETVIMTPGHKLLIWQWYRIGELQTHNPYLAKIYEAYMRLVKGRTDGAYITLSTMLPDEKGIARTRLSTFYNQSVDTINHGLDKLQKNH